MDKLHLTSLEDSKALLDRLCEIMRGLYLNITRMQYSIDESTGKILFTVFGIRSSKTKKKIVTYLFSDAAEEHLGIYSISDVNFVIEKEGVVIFSSKHHEHFHYKDIDAFCARVQSRFQPSIESIDYKILSHDKKRIAIIISGFFPPGEESDIQEWITRNSPPESACSISNIVFLKWGDMPDTHNGLSRELFQKLQQLMRDTVAYVLQLRDDKK